MTTSTTRMTAMTGTTMMTTLRTAATLHSPSDAPDESDQRTRRDHGFTLIELLIVVAILGILGGITAFAVGNLTDKAETTACDAEKRTLSLAIESYRATKDGWPTSMSQLVTAGLIERASTTYELSSTSSGGVIVSVTPRAIAGSACA